MIIKMGPRTKHLLLLAVAVTQTYAAIYDQPSQLPTRAYDYIVVGGKLPGFCYELKGGAHLQSSLGGTAGNVIANRLTENRNIQVLVLEAGGRRVARTNQLRAILAHPTTATKESLHPPSHFYVPLCHQAP